MSNTIVEHRVLDRDGQVMVTAMMTETTRWMPYGRNGILYDDLDKYRIETRILPDGEWEPAAIVKYHPALPPIVIVRGTL